MPDPATITAIHTFVAGTKARAGQVNTNFSNLRGHMLPLSSDTQTASHQTHDLGAPDHHWRRIYAKEPLVINGNQLGKIQIMNLVDGSSPTDIVEHPALIDVTAFRFDETTGVAFQFIVPDEYISGNRLSISLRGYCETATAHFVMEAVSALYKHSLTSMADTTPSNLLTSTSSIQPPAANLMFTNTSLRLTDASGLINAVTVTAGDVIVVKLNRNGNDTSDTNTGYYFLTNLQIDLNN